VTPYYDVDGITIYHADCADVFPFVPPESVGLLLTDPPYGIGWEPPSGSGAGLSAAVARTHRSEPIQGDDAPFDWESLAGYSPRVVFGANYYTTPPGGLLIWDKTGGGKATSFMPGAEVAWTDLVTGCHIFRHMWQGAFRDYVDDEWKSHNRGLHPTQKPTRLMRWIVDRWTEPGDLVFDPYMGSGPVARACADLGRRYIGVEIVEEYCQAAVNRLGQMALDLTGEA
jgi:DNA modification methylase